ncbi:hypothetical protein HNR47_000864 [Methylopila jiangsuensis]|uniref:hypothetical protein n=1 Tax=Methylopila jiangsuensis TaxID=586230 RepID=UPI0022F32E45|nr:hypothetical protein [Methylopila jiangsuensis]MDR6284881.1 hypothetical protein [Methylopila jiangsuensis]
MSHVHHHHHHAHAAPQRAALSAGSLLTCSVVARLAGAAALSALIWAAAVWAMA